MLLGCQRSGYLSGSWSLFRGLGACGSSFWGWLSVGAGRSWGWSVVGLVAWLAKRAPTTCSFVWLVLVAGKGVNRRMLVKSRLLVVADLFSVLLMMEEADAVPWMVALST